MQMIITEKEYQEKINKEVKRLKLSMFLAAFLFGALLGWGFCFNFALDKGYKQAKSECQEICREEMGIK